MGQSRPLFVYFHYFLDTFSIIQIEKSVEGVLGIQTRGRRMVGADETTELWRPLINNRFTYLVESKLVKQEVSCTVIHTLMKHVSIIGAYTSFVTTNLHSKITFVT